MNVELCCNFSQNAQCFTSCHFIGLIVKGNISERHYNLFVASCTWDLCIHGLILLTFVYGYHVGIYSSFICPSPYFHPISEPHIPATFMTIHTVHVSPVMAFSEAIFHIS